MNLPNDLCPLPDGQYAIVECFGHTTLVGRVEEIERYGGKFLQMETLFNSQFLPPRLIGSGAIYAFTPVEREVAWKNQAREEWNLPASLRSAIPPIMLSAPEADPYDDDAEEFLPDFLKAAEEA
jgi:hypothetical protein